MLNNKILKLIEEEDWDTLARFIRNIDDLEVIKEILSLLAQNRHK